MRQMHHNTNTPDLQGDTEMGKLMSKIRVNSTDLKVTLYFIPEECDGKLCNGNHVETMVVYAPANEFLLNFSQDLMGLDAYGNFFGFPKYPTFYKAVIELD